MEKPWTQTKKSLSTTTQQEEEVIRKGAQMHIYTLSLKTCHNLVL
jgi:hypothetical protein